MTSTIVATEIPVRWSNLRNIAKSPAHYRYYLDHPKPETDSMRIGGYAHDLVLGGNGHDYAVYDGIRRGSEWEAFKAEHPGCSILNQREAECARACADALTRHNLALELLTYGATEQPLTWEVAGRACQGRPDVLSTRTIVDLKITNDANPARFRWHALKQAWHAQLAWYYHGAGCHGQTLYLVAVEQKPPHMVCVYEMDESAFIGGTRLWRAWFEQLRVCEDSDTWPGYSDAAVVIEAYEEEPELSFGDEEEV